MIAPVLEIYVVWHPADTDAAGVASAIFDHFHGTPFTGLIGGAVEVFFRSIGWQTPADAPRPLPLDEGDLPPDLASSSHVAVVPLVGEEMAMAVGAEGPWRRYIERIRDYAAASPARFSLFPCELVSGAMAGTQVGLILDAIQRIAAALPEADGETRNSLICRDLTQGLCQRLRPNPNDRLKVFISHTKHVTNGDAEDTRKVIELVRATIATTRLQDFFDANDLQPGEDWAADLRGNAATSALLAIRTDLYPTREWCQREVRIAKEAGMSVVILDAPGPGEERGSFLMDHVPRIPIRRGGDGWNRADVYKALNLLVDESLKRVLWAMHRELAEAGGGLSVNWWAPHAPEPLTFLAWLTAATKAGDVPKENETVVVLHPDPPLGADEKGVLDEILFVMGGDRTLDVFTPRALAARGG